MNGSEQSLLVFVAISPSIMSFIFVVTQSGRNRGSKKQQPNEKEAHLAVASFEIFISLI